MRPIDADMLLDGLDENCGDLDLEYNSEYAKLVHYIDSQPTLDLAPVVHGEWGAAEIIGYDGLHAVYGAKCSACGKHSTEYYRRFCGNCGAKMDGGKTHGRKTD